MNNTDRLVSFNKFKRYINKNNPLKKKFNKKRQSVKIDNMLSFYKKRFTKYKSYKNNNRFITIYNSDILYQNRLNEMLSHFLIDKNRKKVLEMITKNVKDDKILQFIKRNYKIKDVPNRTVIKLLEISNIIYKYLIKKNIKNPKILDVGCGNGNKIKIIKSCLPEIEIYGADIKSWGPYSKNKKFNFPFKFIKENPYKIPYNNNMFDCITVFLTLHHCDDIIKTIKECKRMLNKDGILIIIEHDIWTDEDNMIINLQHLIYRYIFNEKIIKAGNYYNRIEWDIIFNKCKMKNINNKKLTNNATNKLSYDLQYTATYIKNNK